MIKFCHIAPTHFLSRYTDHQHTHLVLAHLLESDPEYRAWFQRRKIKHNDTLIMDNSGFEMYKQNKPMMEAERLVELAEIIHADYIVLPDYPNQHSSKTIKAAVEYAEHFKANGFNTFFVPQSSVGQLDDLLDCFNWASKRRDLIDYIGISILAAPNGYGVEQNNNMQRFVSRYMLMDQLERLGFFEAVQKHDFKIHVLGMVDGPNEIRLLKRWERFITSWDSSAAVWAGLNGISFDDSPTGLLNGKFEKEVDFNFKDDVNSDIVNKNIDYISSLVWGK